MRAEGAQPRTVAVQLLGPVRLLAGDEQLPIGGPGVRGLLALLALNVNRVVPTDHIIDALWGHDPPATARTIVQGNVSQLRRALRSVAAEPATGAMAGPFPGALILTSPPGYQLSIDPDRVDVHHARALLERAAGEPLERRADLLTEAYGLWRGPVLGGVPDSLRAPELDDLRQAVHGARVDADLELGRHAGLIAELSQLVRDNPLAERTVAQLMLALYNAGRRADALELYRKVSRHTVTTLGMYPGADLRALHERMLRDTGGEPAAGTGAPGDSGGSGDAENTENPENEDEVSAPAQLPAAVPELAGRDTELGWLDDLVNRSEAGRSVVGTLTGIAGVGKSALVVAWAHRVAPRFPDGVLFAALHGFDPNQAPLEPAHVLSQFLRGLGVAPADLPERMNERVALYRSLLAERRVLILLDDARNAEQVRPLLPPGAHSVAVVTSRARLDGLVVSHAARARTLDILDPTSAVRLIEELAGSTSHELHYVLARQCGYLPLALRIVGARLAAGPQWTVEQLVIELSAEHTRLGALDVSGSDSSVRAALEVSYRGLPAELASTFRTIGGLACRTVGPYLMAAAGDTGVAEARRRLRALVEHHLLAERGRDEFWPHDLVRLYMRERAEVELSTAQREQVVRAVLRYYQAAADRARRQLLRVVDPLDLGSQLRANLLPPLRGFAAASSWFETEWPNLLSTLEFAHRHGYDAETWQLARVMHTFRVVRPLRDDWARLVDIGMAAADRANHQLARCWMLISRCAIALTFEMPEGSLADAEAALAIATALDDDRLVTSARIHLGCALALLGRYEEALERLGEAVRETERTGDLALRGQALNNCAEAEKRAGRYAEAIGHQLGSLEIDRALGDDSYAVVSLNNLAELHLVTGALEQAQSYAGEAIELSVRRGFALQEAVCRRTLGRALLAASKHEAAVQQLLRSLEVAGLVSAPLAAEVHAELDRIAAGSV